MLRCGVLLMARTGRWSPTVVYGEQHIHQMIGCLILDAVKTRCSKELRANDRHELCWRRFFWHEPRCFGGRARAPFHGRKFQVCHVSIAVLEHLAYPDVAVAEAFRVLKPAEFLSGPWLSWKPFHLDSYFHMTHLGTLRVLQQAGFKVKALAPNRRWTGLRAMAEMILFPGVRSSSGTCWSHLRKQPVTRYPTSHPASVPHLARVA
jgi:hypothetical protein